MNYTERRRAACDECRTRKLKCTGEYPTCSRCLDEHIACIYSTQKTMGRPRKRKLQAIDPSPVSRNEPPRTMQQQISPAELSLVDSAVFEENHSVAEQLTFADLEVPGFATIDDIELPPSSIPSSSSTQMCACLSSMYLTLDNLRSLENLNFPSGLHHLRDALGIAKSCIECDVCPTRFLTATQNVQILGTLLLSISERYSRILKAINEDAKQAEELGQLKTLQIGSTETTSPRHQHVGGLARTSEHLVVELPPSEWKRLAKKVVIIEVHGTSNTDRISFTSVLLALEERQNRWHMSTPTDDCPNPERRAHDMKNGNKDPMCLMLAREAKKLIEIFDFS